MNEKAEPKIEGTLVKIYTFEEIQGLVMKAALAEQGLNLDEHDVKATMAMRTNVGVAVAITSVKPKKKATT